MKEEIIRMKIIFAIQKSMHEKCFIDLSFKEVMKITNNLFMKYCNLDLIPPTIQQIQEDVDLSLNKNAIAIPKGFLKKYEYRKEIVDFYMKFLHKQMGAINE